MCRMKKSYPKSDFVDILLFLEGTYPFVSGGVSSWVHNLINNLKQFNFGIIFLGGSSNDYSEMCYTIPANLKHLEVHYLFDDVYKEVVDHKDIYKANYENMKTIHEKFTFDNKCPIDIVELNEILFGSKAFNINDFLYSEASWDYINDKYSANCPNISFLDYFWMVRNMHKPIWKLLNMMEAFPKTKISHSVSTGYAGFLGALFKIKHKNPFILTEHGIYVKERKIDLLSQMTTVGNESELLKIKTQQQVTEINIKFFEVLSKICYQQADPIISLFKGYSDIQIESGAPIEKSMIIPNGVTIQSDSVLQKTEPNINNPIIALIGRVVPIKDIKTFIRSLIIIKKQIPNIKAWIVGPTSEDEEYYEECMQLINVLEIKESIDFLGQQQVDKIYNQIDLTVLSSISEGLPLVVLESYSSGVPVVATDVGSCSELIYGSSPEDQEIGVSGLIVKIADPNALGNAIVKIIKDKELWRSAQLAGKERVKRFYSQGDFIDSYTKIYNEAIKLWQE
ncbi:GT4 family glycosyltransferase PelF [Gammaproteobacteria bacterium]|nr:GT4 family glycosyltransferase PelF [Gammaproteobacteria bacterium]